MMDPERPDGDRSSFKNMLEMHDKWTDNISSIARSFRFPQI